MDGSRSRTLDPGRLLLAVLLADVALGLLAVRYLEIPGPQGRVTVGTVVVAVLLIIGALALPALILSGWQSDGKSR